MEKVIRYILAAAVLVAVSSCRFEDEAFNSLSNNTYGFASSVCQYILESAVNAMEQKVDNEEVFKDGFIIVHDAEYYGKIEIRKMDGADSTWVVRNAVTEADRGGEFYAYNFNPAFLDYTLILRLEKKKDADIFNNWTGTFEGTYDERDGYTATMKTMYDYGIQMYWKKTTYTNTVQYSLTGKGSCEVQFFLDGNPLDRVVFKYRDN